MDFLQLKDKTILVMGVANRKSVAYATAKLLEEAGAKVIYSVRSEQRKESVAKLLKDKPVYVCDVENSDEIQALGKAVGEEHGPISGLVHSIAFANYSEGLKPFHETLRKDFLQATQISSFSLVELANAFKPYFAPDASVVAIGISSILITADNYGYMGPSKQPWKAPYATSPNPLAKTAKSVSIP